MSQVDEDAAEQVRTDFDRFVREDSERLRRALVARFGVDIGTEAHADAMAWAWEHRDRLPGIANPVAYLYRVGQSVVRPHLRWRRRVTLVEVGDVAVEDPAETELVTALARLTSGQRVCVVMVHGHGFAYGDVAEVLEISVAAVTNHVHRGMRRLRRNLEVS